jgi:nucleoside-diphosphate-sugar epimerase
LALERGLVGETYNIGGNESITLLEAIDLLGRVFGVVPKTSMQPAIPGDQRATVANYAKAAEALGYSPKTEASQGLQAQAEWYLAEGRFDGA